MNKRETVQALMDLIQKGDFETAKPMLADDFQFSGLVPEPINKEAWLEMSSILRTGFPDLNYHFKVIGAEGDVVRAISQLSGTHTGSFDLTSMNMGVIPTPVPPDPAPPPTPYDQGLGTRGHGSENNDVSRPLTPNH